MAGTPTQTGNRRLGVLIRAGRSLLDAVIPQTCVVCGTWVAGRQLACERCNARLLRDAARAACPRCGRTLPSVSIHDDQCARCRTEPYWNVAGVARAGAYSVGLRPLVLGLKYRGRQRNAAYLAGLLAAAVRSQEWGDSLDALVPVPMHWLRRVQRPCNHAHVLAEALGRRLDLPVIQPLRRIRHDPSQTGITSRTKRFENVRDCFAPRRRRRPDVAGKTVCIVDNLLATGATIYETSKVLRRLGAKPIYVVVAVRTVAPGDPPSIGSLPAPPALAEPQDSGFSRWRTDVASGA